MKKISITNLAIVILTGLLLVVCGILSVNKE